MTNYIIDHIEYTREGINYELEKQKTSCVWMGNENKTRKMECVPYFLWPAAAHKVSFHPYFRTLMNTNKRRGIATATHPFDFVFVSPRCRPITRDGTSQTGGSRTLRGAIETSLPYFHLFIYVSHTRIDCFNFLQLHFLASDSLSLS